MKYLIFLSLLISCQEMPTIVETTKKPLEWSKDHKTYDDYIYKSISKISFPDDSINLCKTISKAECLAQLLSIMAKYESSFNTDAKYLESFRDSKGHRIMSRGLLQLSQESANQSAYSCGISNAKQLHNPEKNIDCAVKIMNYWIKKDKVFIGPNKQGCARYWSVCRESSDKKALIMKYMEQF